jgi:hypothetical protein
MKFILLTLLLASKLLSADYSIEFDRYDFDRGLIRQKVEDVSRFMDVQLQKLTIREKAKVIDGKNVKIVYLTVTYASEIDVQKYVVEFDRVCAMKTTMIKLNPENKDGG